MTQPTAKPPVSSAEPYQDFPADALPGAIRDFVVAGARAIGCDSSFIALPLLTALGAAIGNSRRLRVKRGWLVPPILWTAIVGESGTSKTPAFRLALKAIRERQRRAMARHPDSLVAYQEDLAYYEKAMAEWKRSKSKEPPPGKPEEPQPERCVVSDTTVEALAPLLLANDRGLLMARDELAGWIGSFDRYASGGKGADASHWLSMHGGESITVDRKTGTPRTIYVPRAAVSVTGGIQPGILSRVLGAEHRESGLAARLLLACPPRKPKRWTENDINPEIQERVADIVDRIFGLCPGVDENGEPHPVAIGMTREAKASWVEYYNAHAEEQAELYGDLAAAWSKLEEAAARLALVIHLARWADGEADPETVDAWSMSAGITLARWFAGQAKRTYALMSEGEEEKSLRQLLDWINERGGSVTARDVSRGLSRYRDAVDCAETDLNKLARAGEGVWVDGQRDGPGRPTRRFVTNQKQGIPATTCPAIADDDNYAN